MDILIQAEKVEKTFTIGKRKVEAVRGVSLQVRRGECFGLLGPNGAGKSTLISMLYGTTVRTGGELKVFSLDPNQNSRQIKRRLGVVTQENALDESLSVQENMELYAAFVGVAPNQRRARVKELLELMSLAHKAQDNIRFLSGGMKRRLVFVRALLGDPELVILDEPTTGLDPAVRHLLWGKVNELKRAGKTVILTTHYMHEAEVLCDRLVILNQGQVIAEGSPQALRQRFTPGYVAVFDSQQSPGLRVRAEALSMQVIQDSSGLYIRAPELANLLKLQEDTGTVALQMRPSNLEDVFLKLTGQGLSANMTDTFVLSWHIVRRNWQVYKKNFISNISPTLADPAFMILSLGVGLGAYLTKVDGRSYLQFLAPGLAVSTAMFTAFFETSYGFYVRLTYENVFKAMLTTPIGVNEVVLGEFMWIAIKGALMVFGVCLVLFGLGLFTNPWLLVVAPLIGVLIALPLGAMGLIASCYVSNINQFQTVYSFLIAPIYFFSGIFFPVDQMPSSVQWIAKALPLYHGVKLSQSLFWDEDVWTTWSVHAPLLLGYGVVLLYWAHRKVGRKLQN